MRQFHVHKLALGSSHFAKSSYECLGDAKNVQSKTY